MRSTAARTEPTVDPVRWPRVKALFQRVLDLPEDARAGALEAASRDDPAVADAVRGLLAAHAGADGALRPLDHGGGDAPPPRIGPYRPQRLLGRGGMGEVWLCERAEGGFQQQVAVKRIAGSLLHPEARQRFLRERQVLARLSHPNIARLFDGGVDDAGRPWFALEYVDGEPIDAWCDARRLDLRARMRLLLQAVDAVAFAHRRLVVHRDLKPANLLVADGRAVLLDFGIARLLEDDDGAAATASGLRLFTPDHAAPEQLLGEPVSTATDVWALGLLGFQLACGRAPFAGAGPRRASSVLTGEPDTLRTALLREPDDVDILAAARAAPRRELLRALDADLDSLLRRALSRSPEDRHPSAAALADDLRAWLERRPLVHADSGAWARLRSFARRHRLALAAVSVVLATGAAGLAATLWQAREAQRAAQAAAREAATATAVRRAFTGLFEAADPDRGAGADPTVREALDAGLPTLERELAQQPAVRDALLSDIGAVYRAVGDDASAVEVLRRAAGDPTRPVADADHALAAMRLADALLASGDAAGARAALEPARGFATSRALPDPLALRFALLQATVDRDSDQLARAEAALAGLAATLSAQRPVPREALADVLDAQGELHLNAFREGEAVVPMATARGLLRAANAGPTELARADAQLARALGSDRQVAVAELLLRDTIAELEQRLGPDHPVTLTNLGYLGTILQAGRPEAAREVLARQLEGRQRRFGATHPSTAAAWNNLAVVDYALRRYDAAADGFRRARAIWLERLGPAHDLTLRTTANLAGALAQTGRLAEALPLLDDAVAARRTRGENSVLYGVLLTRGLAREAAGDAAAALADFEEACAIGATTWADDPSQWVWSRALRGRALFRARRFDAARAELEAAVAHYANDAIEDGPRTATAMIELAMLLHAQREEPGRARSLAAAAVAAFEAKLGAEHPDTIDARRRAATLDAVARPSTEVREHSRSGRSVAP
jgi:serine/threonine-protein kinase